MPENRDLDFFVGYRCGILQCCIFFYEMVWLPKLRDFIPEYDDTMWELSKKSGILLCPDCIAKNLTHKVL